MRRFLTRRAALTLLASAAAFPSAVNAAPGQRFRAIEVDVSPLRANGDTITAGWMAETLPALLRTAFAGQLSPGDRSAPVLVARIDSVSYGSPGSAQFAGISTLDYIEGAAVVKSGGRTLGTYPLTTSASVFNQTVNSPNDNTGKLRAEQLAGVFARYLPGQIGL